MDASRRFYLCSDHLPSTGFSLFLFICQLERGGPQSDHATSVNPIEFQTYKVLCLKNDQQTHLRGVETPIFPLFFSISRCFCGLLLFRDRKIPQSDGFVIDFQCLGISRTPKRFAMRSHGAGRAAFNPEEIPLAAVLRADPQVSRKPWDDVSKALMVPHPEIAKTTFRGACWFPFKAISQATSLVAQIGYATGSCLSTGESINGRRARLLGPSACRLF